MSEEYPLRNGVDTFFVLVISGKDTAWHSFNMMSMLVKSVHFPGALLFSTEQLSNVRLCDFRFHTPHLFCQITKTTHLPGSVEKTAAHRDPHDFDSTVFFFGQSQGQVDPNGSASSDSKITPRSYDWPLLSLLVGF